MIAVATGKDCCYKTVAELLREHPPERPAGEEVDVEVRHFLAAVLAHVGQQRGSRCASSPRSFATLPTARMKPAISLGAGAGAEVGERDVAPLRDHQHMRRRLRVDVVEGERPLVLMDLLAGDLAAQDAGEDVGVVVGRQAADTAWLISRRAARRAWPGGQGIFVVSSPNATGRSRARAAFSAMPLMPSRRFSSSQTSSGRMPAATQTTIRW